MSIESVHEDTRPSNCKLPDEVLMPLTPAVVCAVVVTFNPDSDLSSQIERVIKQVHQVVIVDNGSKESCLSLLRQIAGKPGVHLILNPVNEGIARGLNQGATWASGKGYGWVLTLDQDTIVAEDIMKSFAEVYRTSSSDAELAVIGSNFINSRNGRPFYDFTDPGGSLGKEVKTVITSGSLVSLRVFHLIGGFREEFFIDGVDLEYCLRARTHGFRVMIVCRPLMVHSIGHLSEHRLWWKKTGTTNHSPWRYYFMARNTMILAREYARREPGWVLSTLWSRTKSLLLMTLFEKECIRKIGYSVLGGFDGARGKTNRLSGFAVGK